MRGSYLQRLEVFDEVALLLVGEPEVADIVVVLHHIRERPRAAVVEVRRVLPQSPERRGAVPLLRRARGVPWVHSRFTRVVQPSRVHVRERGARALGGAGGGDSGQGGPAGRPIRRGSSPGGRWKTVWRERRRRFEHWAATSTSLPRAKRCSCARRGVR